MLYSLHMICKYFILYGKKKLKLLRPLGLLINLFEIKLFPWVTGSPYAIIKDLNWKGKKKCQSDELEKWHNSEGNIKSKKVKSMSSS